MGKEDELMNESCFMDNYDMQEGVKNTNIIGLYSTTAHEDYQTKNKNIQNINIVCD